MYDQPDLIGLQISEFRQKNEDAKKLCKKSRGSYLIITERNSHFTATTATQHLQRLYARAGIVGANKRRLTALSTKEVEVRELGERWDMRAYRQHNAT